MFPPPFRATIGAALAVAVLSLAGAASAQSMDDNMASYNAGWGRTAGSENHLPSYGSRDANGNRVIIDGVIQTGEDQSYFNRTTGAGDAYSGVGSLGGGATAIGNNLVVVTTGNYNTVIVDSTQINNGNVSAGAGVATGGVGNAQ